MDNEMTDLGSEPGQIDKPNQIGKPNQLGKPNQIYQADQTVPSDHADQIDQAIKHSTLEQNKYFDEVSINQLSAFNIAKSYQSRHIVNQVSLNVSGGEIVGLLGPNGAGKTSCFYMMLGLIRPDAGQIYLNNIDVTLLPVHIRARLGMGYLPQEASVFRKLTVAQNIMAILETRLDLDQAMRENTLQNLLQEFRITHVKNSLGISLSGGERRRVEIARALATNPKFMLLDEPFAGVDPISIIDIKQVIHHLRKRGIGILITDHNVRDTLDICDRAYIMNQGKIIAEGTTEHILTHIEVRKVYLGENFEI